MLSELKISNFRIFDDEVTVRFRPITVLIGRNSSGKSSIIKFLLMLQQSAVPGQAQFLTPEGSRVKLGAFPTLKNTLTKKNNLVFDLSVRNADGGIDPFIKEQLGLSETVGGKALGYRVQASVRYSRTATRGRAHFSVGQASTGGHVFAFHVRYLEDSSFWHYPRQSTEIRHTALTSIENEDPESRAEVLEGINRLIEEASKTLTETLVVDNLGYHVNSIRHLLPVRAESEKVVQLAVPPVDDVGQSGEYTLPHLQQMAAGQRDRYEFIRPHLERITGVEEIKFKTSTGYVSQAFARNMTTSADVLIADFGFGVGQCLPILVQGAIMAPETTLMVEQPEAQLHPTAQLELGSYFAALWNERKVGSIIETHSDNILLRLRRLIARGDLSHKDVSVAFFTLEEESNMPVVKNLDINEDGSMEAGLPMEFFGRNVIEGIRLGARK